MRKMEEDMQGYEERYGQNEEEVTTMKQDMQSLLGYKNELELLVEEQSQNISVTSKRIVASEESLRYKENELDQKEGVLRRTIESSAEMKKKLM